MYNFARVTTPAGNDVVLGMSDARKLVERGIIKKDAVVKQSESREHLFSLLPGHKLSEVKGKTAY